MPVTFEQPILFVALLPLALLFLILARRSQRPRPRLRRLLSLAVRLLTVGLLLAALAGPQSEQDQPVRRLVFLVDRSASVPEAQQQRIWADLGTALADAGETQVAVVCFAGRAMIAKPFDRRLGEPPGDLQPDRTDLVGALRLARGMLPVDGTNRIVLISDGDATGSDSATVLAAADRSIPVDTILLAKSDAPALSIERLDLPPSVRPREPFDLGVHLRATIDTTVTLAVELNGVVWSNAMPGPVRLQAGERKVVLLTNLLLTEERAANRIGVQVRSDRETELTDSVVTPLFGAPRARLLLVESASSEGEALAQALTAEGMVVIRRPGRELPSELSELRAFDALILSNLPAEDLQPEQRQAIVSYVREEGGGLLMLGGDRSFGPGGYARTVLAPILPVQMAAVRPATRDALAIVFLIDRSASMKGAKIRQAVEAVQQSIKLLDRRDAVGIITFAAAPEWLVRPAPVSDPDRVAERLATVMTAGGTEFLPALQMAARDLGGSDAARKHVVLLTDGKPNSGRATLPSVAGAMAKNGITVSTVGVGRDADRSLLERIARQGGGRAHYAANPRAIPQIVVEETKRALEPMVVDRKTRVIVHQYDRSIQGIDFDHSPPLGGFVATTARANLLAKLILKTERGDPILAVWPVGLGRVAAFTSDAKGGRWGDGWVRWRQFQPFWGQLLRSIARRRAPQRIVAESRATVREGIIEITTSVHTHDGGYAPNVKTSVRMERLDGTVVADLSAKSVAPGLFRARVPISGAGEAYTATVRQISAVSGERLAEQRVAIPQVRSPERRLRPANARLLRELARLTGGQVDPPMETVLTFETGANRRTKEVWTLFVLAAALLLPIDLLLRRL